MQFAQGLKQGITEAMVAAMIREAGNQMQTVENHFNQQAREAEKVLASAREEIARLQAQVKAQGEALEAGQKATVADTPNEPIRPRRNGSAATA